MSCYTAIIPACRTSRRLYELIAGLEKEIEVVLVWNAEERLDTKRLEALHPRIRWKTFDRKIGYAGACNAGAVDAQSEVLLFLNDDVALKPGWREALEKTLNSADCVAFQILDGAGKKVDFAGGAMNLFAYGISLHNNQPVKNLSLHDSDTLFPCGAAFAIKRDAFYSTGGFDEDYFAFFEDVDFGWRLNLLGYRVRFCPKAIAFHFAGSSTRRFGIAWKQHLLQRNSLMSIVKNYEDNRVVPMLSFALTSAMEKHKECARRAQKALSHAYLQAVQDFLALLTRTVEKREKVQARRLKSDKEIFPLFRLPFHPAHLTELPTKYLKEAGKWMEK